VATCPTPHIQYPPPGSEAHCPADQSNCSTGVRVVAVRVQPKVIFAEPLFEPFGHRSRVGSRESGFSRRIGRTVRDP